MIMMTRRNISRDPVALILFVVFLALIKPSEATTIVGGMITTDTVWKVANSPYIAEQSVLVMNGATLSIEPGVTVRFNPAMALSVSDGSLVARGTESSNITFTANASPPDVATNRWGYVGFWDLARDACFDAEGHYTNGCILEHAVIEYAGGADLQGAVHAEHSAPFVTECSIRGNAIGGIYVDSSPSVLLYGNDITSNSASRYGGGICVMNSHNVAILRNRITGTHTSDDGGGVFIASSDDCIFIGNVVSNNTTYSRGGGISLFGLYGSLCTLSNNEINCNSAPNDRGGGIWAHSAPALLLSCNTIVGNSSLNGGGVCISASAEPLLSGNSISQNAAWNGGGVYFEGSYRADLSGNTITSNSASSKGGGILFSSSNDAHLQANTIGSNLAPAGGGVFLEYSTGVVFDMGSTRPNVITDNGTPQIYNENSYGGSPFPYGSGNVDARNVWWGTTNAAAIQSMIYDFFDNAGKGIVFCEPFFLGWATNDVPINWLQDHGLGTDDTAAMSDQDGDGSANWQEFYAGTDPTNEQSVLMVKTVVPEAVSNTVLTWLSVSNKTYTIESSSSLTTGLWGMVVGGIQGCPPMNTITAQVDSANGTFYRIKVN